MKALIPTSRYVRSRAYLFLALGLILACASFARFTLAQPHAEPHADHGTTEQPEAKVHADGSHAEGGHAESGHAEGVHHGPEPLNWTDLSDKHRPAFVAMLVNFGLLVALYYTLGKKPVAQGLRQRRISISKEIEEAGKMFEEAKARAERYQGKLKNADADAASAKADLITAGKGEVESLLEDAQERAERMKRDAERLVEQERKQLQLDLHVETVNVAMERAHKLLERGATPEDHARLADELLAELAQKPAAPRAGTAVRGAA